MTDNLQPYQKNTLERLAQTNIRFVEFSRSTGRTFRTRNAVDAVLRRAHFLCLARQSETPAQAWIDEAPAVVAFPMRGLAAAPSLTGATTADHSTGGDDAA